MYVVKYDKSYKVSFGLSVVLFDRFMTKTPSVYTLIPIREFNGEKQQQGQESTHIENEDGPVGQNDGRNGDGLFIIF